MGTTVNVVHTSVCPDIGPICATGLEPPQLHDQQFWIAELRLLAEYAFFDWLSAELQFPLRLSATSIVYRHLNGVPFVPEQPDIHHRDETLLGVGDPWLSARGRWAAGGFFLGARLGFTVPLGRTEENPFALGRQGLQHQHIQFGTGTVTPLVGLDASRALGALTARLSGQAQLSLVENRHGFLAGSRYAVGVATDWRVVPSLELGLTFDALTELPERWNGAVEQDGNLGRTDLLLGAQVRWTVDGMPLTVSARSPVYQFINNASRGDEGQLTYPVIVLLGFERPFDLLR